MANNRMWLRCRGCGELFLLGKCYWRVYSSYYTEMSVTFDEYASEHHDCGEVDSENQFELVYDHAVDEGVKESGASDTMFSRPFNYGEVVQ